MAERRMFTKKITDDDHFFQLSSAAQALYLHLSMSADDDGFCNQISIAMLKAHAMPSDLEQLLVNRYIYQFENGVIVIKHWRMANALRKDRYTPTVFKEEMAQLGIKDNGSYTWLPDGCQVVAAGKDSIGKVSIDKDSIESVDADASRPPLPFEECMNPPEEPTEEEPPQPKLTKHKYGTYKHVMLTNLEHSKLVKTFGETKSAQLIEKLDEYIEESGKRYKNHYLVIAKKDSWVQREVLKSDFFDPMNIENYEERQAEWDKIICGK